MEIRTVAQDAYVVKICARRGVQWDLCNPHFSKVFLYCFSQVESKPVSALLKSRRLKQVVTATKDMSLRAAKRLMAGRGLRQIPVVDGSQRVVGLLDRGSIALACRLEHIPQPPDEAQWIVFWFKFHLILVSTLKYYLLR